MINVFKEESPKGHFKLIRKPSCDMMNAHFWVKIHTLNPLAHGRPPCLPNCLRIWSIWSFWFIFLSGTHLQLHILNKLWALFLMMSDQYWHLARMKKDYLCALLYAIWVFQHVDFMCLEITKQSKSCNYLWQSGVFLSLYTPQRLIHSGSKSFLRLSVAWHKHIHHPRS